MQNEHIGPRAYFAPLARELLSALAATPLPLVLDGSQVGRDCMALAIAMVYKGLALPIGWLEPTLVGFGLTNVDFNRLLSAAHSYKAHSFGFWCKSVIIG